jgi:serine/threonine protein kinase
MQTCPNCRAQNQDAANFCAFCGHNLAGLLSTGAVLQGRYRIAQLLGKGGMGAVYQAQDLRLGGRLVAVKENFDTSAEAQAQFQLEANMLANLNQSNLPRVMDHFVESSGKQYLVMDFVEGEDLEQMLARQGRLTESQALRWFGQVCEAVAHIHGQSPPIIHRDIKPANVVVTPAGKAMLVDLGIAKVYQYGQKTAVAARAVTPGFSPPEQYGGAPTDARSDIYALGATLYCMLTGQVPPEAMDRLGGARLTPPRQLNQAVSSATEGAILRAMELNSPSRPQTVEELRQALGRRPVEYTVPPASVPAAPSVQPLVKQRPAPVPAPVPTPAPAVAPFQFAGFGQRFIASLIDGIVLWIAGVLIGAIALVLASDSTYDSLTCCLQLLPTGLSFSYYTYFHAHSGQTPGKKAMRIKVVSSDGSPVSTGKSIVRTIGYWISTLFFCLGFLWMLWDQDKQTWHDKMAGTYVIKV